jgi:hypothetical protein
MMGMVVRRRIVVDVVEPAAAKFVSIQEMSAGDLAGLRKEW